MAGSTFKNELYSYLSGNSAITGALGTPPRLYPVVAPTSAVVPYATYSVVSDEHQSHLGAASGLTKTTVQIDTWSGTYGSADSASTAFRNALDGYQGKIWNPGPMEIRIDSARLVAQRDDYTEPTDGSQNGVHRVSMDFSFWHNELLPTNVEDP